MPDSLLLTIESVLVVTFSWAVVAKLSRWSVWQSSLGGYGLEGPQKNVAAVGVPLAELAVAMLLLFGPVRVGLAATLGLVGPFSLAILQARARSGDRVPCGCFGKTEERDYRWLLVRNGVLAALAGIALLGGADETVTGLWEAPTASDILPAVLVATGVVLVAWLGWHVATLLRKEHP